MTVSVLDAGFAADVAREAEFDPEACLNCGVCTAVCPLGIDILPRRLFHLVLLGERDEVLRSAEALYSCLLCRLCEAHCPAGVHITANVRALRHYVNHHVLGI